MTIRREMWTAGPCRKNFFTGHSDQPAFSFISEATCLIREQRLVTVSCARDDRAVDLFDYSAVIDLDGNRCERSETLKDAAVMPVDIIGV